MAPAGRGGLRPYQPSKFQPFLIVCLLVTVVVVGYNFWNLMKKNSVLLVEIGKIQIAVRRLESERKDCSVQLASVEGKRKEHEAADSEKEIALEDTRRIVEDLKAENEVLRQNVTKLLSQIVSAESRVNESRSECDKKWEEMRMELQDSCLREKEKIQQEMGDQLSVLKSRLKQQYQETEHLDQMLQQQKQEPVNENSKDAARQAGNTAQPEQRQPLGNGAETVQRTQQEQPQIGRQYHGSRLSGRLERIRSANGRSRLNRGNLTYHSKRSSSFNSERAVRDERPEQPGSDQVLRLKQTEKREIPEGSSLSVTKEVSSSNQQQGLNQESENRESVQKVQQLGAAGDEVKPVPEGGEPASETKNSDSDQNAGEAVQQRAKLAQESDNSMSSQRSESRDQGQGQGQGQNDENPENREAVPRRLVQDPSQLAANSNQFKQNYQSRQREDDGQNLPKEIHQLNHQDNGNPVQN